MRAGSGRNSARATASPMSIVPKEVNITIVTLSSTLDDIFGLQCGAASALLAPLCSLTSLDETNW